MRAFRLGRAAFFLLLTITGFTATASEFRVLIDADFNAGTGCAATTVDGPVQGIEQILTAVVNDGVDPQAVISIEHRVCTGAAFGAPAVTAANWPVGSSGTLRVVEAVLPLAAVAPSQQIRVYAASSVAAGGNDDAIGPLVVSIGALGGAADVPTASELALIFIALLLIIVGLFRLRGMALVAMMLVATAAGVGVAWAALVADGNPSDWIGTSPLSSDPSDAPDLVDMRMIFAQSEGSQLFFRIDADAIASAGPEAVDDAFESTEDAGVSGNLLSPNPTTADSDADGDPLSVTAVNGVSGNVGATFALPSGAILNVSASGAFTLDPNGVHNGLRTGATAIDTFTYTVDDGNGGSDTATVVVTFTGTNDAPVASDTALAVLQSAPAGTAIGAIPASDVDAGDVLTFAITAGNGAGAFAINASTGVITVASSGALSGLGVPAVSLTVTASDDGSPSLFDTSAVTVTISSGGNTPPVVNDQGFAIAEGSANGTVVGTVAATDADGGQTLSFVITSGNTSGAFSINASTGVITVANTAAVDPAINPSFNLVVQVTDNGSPALSDTATINITVSEVNDAPAVNNQAFGIPENAANGTIVGTVAATDPDAGQTLAFTITSGNTSGAFAIHGVTGQITVANNAALDAGANPTFNLIVQVTDNGTPPLGDTATVTINVSAVNDAPVVNNQGFSVNEQAPNGTTVGGVVATDADTGQTLTYAITAGNTSGAFTINASTGVITVANSPALDSNVNPTFSLTVQVTDNGVPVLNDTATVTITVSDTLNDAPVVNDQAFSVAEQAANTTPIGTVAAIDVNGGQTLTFSITAGNTSGAFAINASTGAITVANSAALNASVNPTFSLTVQVTDSGAPPLSDTATISVTVNDTINDAPVINDQAFGVGEQAANGTTVGGVAATDPNPTQTLAFAITAGNTSGAFAIAPATGVLTVANSAALDANVNPAFSLTVQVTDNGTPVLSDTATITITVSDTLNDAPVVNDQSFSADEGTANTTPVGTVSASDVNSGQTLTFSITAGNTAGAFAINPSTGVITVANSAALDSTVTPSFSLIVQVTDNGGTPLSDTATVTITVNDTVNDPPNVADQSFAVNEFTPNNTVIGTVAASDPNAGQVLSYAIIGGSGDGSFVINVATGAIRVVESTDLNATYNPSLDLTVRVRDNGVPQLSRVATMTITINDTTNDAPVVADQTFAVNEQASNGTSVGTVAATDVNAGQSISYAITAGNTSGAFAINPSTGALTVANGTALDETVNPSFSLTVQVTDNAPTPLSDTATITVNVNDTINDAPTLSDAVYSVAEGTAVGAVVGTLSVTDPNAGQTLTWSILGGNTGTAFSVDAAGVLRVASATLSYQTTPSYTLTVRVTDDGVPSLFDDATITVNVLDTINNAPVVNDQTFSISNSGPIGNTVGHVAATDPNSGQSLTWQILSGNAGDTFEIDPNTGQITVFDGYALDMTPTFTLVVQVTDDGTAPLSDTASITINTVGPGNPPVMPNQTFTVAENQANGTTVGTMTATDADGGGPPPPEPPDVLTWSIIGGNTGGAFAINPATGLITVANAAALLHHVNPQFSLLVQVADDGTPVLTDTATAVITVTDDVNDAPVVDDAEFTIRFLIGYGNSVGAVPWADVNAPPQTVSFSITAGNTNDSFAIDSTGMITVNDPAAIYNAGPAVYTLTVLAEDNGTPPLSDTATVVVNVTNTDNQHPFVSYDFFYLDENSAAGTLVGTGTGSDGDVGQTLTWSIISGNDGGAFAIDPDTAQIRVLTPAALDYETQQTFLLVIKATDNGTPSLFDTGQITVNINDANDPPLVEGGHKTIYETFFSVGTSVTSVVANDADVPAQTLTYAIVGGNTGGAFAINSSTGAITAATPAAIDHETNPFFDLAIAVTDNGSPAKTGNGIVRLDVNDSNEPATFPNQTFTIPEHSPASTVVGTVSYTDPDIGEFRRFSITGGNPGGTFAIGQFTGTITVADSALLDLESFASTPHFTLTVKMEDGGEVPILISAAITINLTDQNDPPVMNNQAFAVNERSANGTVVGTIAATDEVGQTLTYQATGGTGTAIFALNSSNGRITVADNTTLVYESGTSYTLIVLVTDNGSPSLSDTATVTINVNNINTPPAINNQSFSIGEGTASGTTVGTVIASDVDVEQTWTFAITGGNPGNVFTIGNGTGTLTLNSGSVDHEATPSFALTVQATDDGVPAQSSSATITVTIGDVNEPPTAPDGSTSIAENPLNGAAVATVSATDPDNGQTLSYVITGGNASGAFAINSSSGAITVADPTQFNYESTTSFTLTVLVTDNGIPALSDGATITITVLNVNEAPVPANATFIIQEAQPNGTVVGSVSVSEPDASQTHTFTLASGNPGGAFALNSSTGQLTVANSAALNFNTNPTFTLGVNVADNGVPVLNGSCTITVQLTQTPNAIPAISPQTFSVDEHRTNGFAVGTVVATDGDAGQTLSFTIIAGGTGDGILGINSSTGAITVLNSAALNYESATSLTLVVRVSDNFAPPGTASATMTININNINEPVVANDATFAISENDPNGTVVGTVAKTDPDLGQTYLFQILSGNAAGEFAIGSATGQITVANSPLNPSTPQYVLTVRVTDNGVPATFDDAVITINVALSNSIPTPIASPVETFGAVGNTTLQLAAARTIEPTVFAAGTLLSNFTDSDGPSPLTTALVPASVSVGASVVLNADGTFVYRPPVGKNTGNTDTFQYTVTDGIATLTRTATVQFTQRVWYVQNDSAPGGLGRSTDPFDTLLEAQTASAAGDTIYVFDGDGTTARQNAGIVLKANQRLIGEGVALTINAALNGASSPATLASAGTRPLIGNTGVASTTVSMTASGATVYEVRGIEFVAEGRGLHLLQGGGGAASAVISDVVVGAVGVGINVNSAATGSVTVTIANAAITAVNYGIDFLVSTTSSLTLTNISVGDGLNAAFGIRAQSSAATAIVLNVDGVTLTGRGMEINKAGGTIDDVTVSGITDFNRIGMDITRGGTTTFTNLSILEHRGYSLYADDFTDGATLTFNNAVITYTPADNSVLGSDGIYLRQTSPSGTSTFIFDGLQLNGKVFRTTSDSATLAMNVEVRNSIFNDARTFVQRATTVVFDNVTITDTAALPFLDRPIWFDADSSTSKPLFDWTVRDVTIDQQILGGQNTGQVNLTGTTSPSRPPTTMTVENLVMNGSISCLVMTGATTATATGVQCLDVKGSTVPAIGIGSATNVTLDDFTVTRASGSFTGVEVSLAGGGTAAIIQNGSITGATDGISIGPNSSGSVALSNVQVSGGARSVVWQNPSPSPNLSLGLSINNSTFTNPTTNVFLFAGPTGLNSLLTLSGTNNAVTAGAAAPCTTSGTLAGSVTYNTSTTCP